MTQGGVVGGSLEGIVQQQVGDFLLVQAEVLAEDQLTELGATEGAFLAYESPEGVRVGHGVVVFESQEEASATLGAFTDYIVASGYLVQETFPVTSVDGQPLGDAVVLGNGELEAVVWTNGNIFAFAVAPVGEGIPFYYGLAY